MSSLGAWIIESGGLPIVPVSSTDMTMSPSSPPPDPTRCVREAPLE